MAINDNYAALGNYYKGLKDVESKTPEYTVPMPPVRGNVKTNVPGMAIGGIVKRLMQRKGRPGTPPSVKKNVPSPTSSFADVQKEALKRAILANLGL